MPPNWLLKFLALTLIAACAGLGQSMQPLPTAPMWSAAPDPSEGEVKLVTFILRIITDVAEPDAGVGREQRIARQFGMEEQDWAALRSAAASYRSSAEQMREEFEKVIGESTVLNKSQQPPAAAALLAQEEAVAHMITKQFLQKVRPSVAARIRHRAALVIRAR